MMKEPVTFTNSVPQGKVSPKRRAGDARAPIASDAAKRAADRDPAIKQGSIPHRQQSHQARAPSSYMAALLAHAKKKPASRGGLADLKLPPHDDYAVGVISSVAVQGTRSPFAMLMGM